MAKATFQIWRGGADGDFKDYKRCTKACPEGISITDNAITPLKERVVDEFYDPVRRRLRVFRPKKKEP